MMQPTLAHIPLALALALAATGASAAPPLPAPLSGLSAPIEASVQLPGTGVQMIESDGTLFFLAGNGRYVFTGSAWDLWHGERLDSVAEASALAGRVDLARLPLTGAELGAFQAGSAQRSDAGDQRSDEPLNRPLAWVFVDPVCPHCRALLQSLDDDAIAAQVVLLPIGGEDSLAAARRIHCAPDRGAAWSALLAQGWSALPSPAADCDTQPLVRALITAHLLGVEQVPLLIAADGRLHQGVPDDLNAWLAGE
jgi:thiol:disulfide interchange protein DsbC